MEILPLASSWSWGIRPPTCQAGDRMFGLIKRIWRSVAPDSDDVVLDLRKVCKQFGTDPAVNALIDVDLVVRRGEWLSITGPSGSGKTTLLNMLGCLDRPTSGQYLVDGIETTTLDEQMRAGL